MLPIDMWEYFRAALPGGSEDHRELLHAGTTEFWNPATVPFELECHSPCGTGSWAGWCARGAARTWPC